MNKLSKTLLVVSGILMLAASANAAEIYRWTDADGNVHFGDRPASGVDVERMNLVSRATDPGRVQASIDARLERESELDESRQARLEKKAEAEKGRMEAEKRARTCQENRSRLRSYNESRRLYREDENGERVYLDDTQRKEAEDKVRDLIDEYCS
jgi:hypothetical protein